MINGLNYDSKHWKIKLTVSVILYFVAFAGALWSCYIFSRIGPFVAYTRIIKTLLMAPLPMLIATIIMYKLSSATPLSNKILNLCWWYFFIVYSIILLFVLLGGGRRDYDYSGMVPNLFPFVSIGKDISSAITIYNGRYNLRPLLSIAGNAALFIPLAFLLPWKIKKKHKLIVSCVMILISVIIIETVQQIMSVGIFDIDDILLNFLGIIFGVLLNRIANKILTKNSIFLEGVDIQNH